MIKFLATAAFSLLASGPGLAASIGELSPGSSRAELAVPAAKPMYGIIDGRLWDCEGKVCVAQPNGTARAQSASDECHRAAKWLGKFTSFQSGATVFTDEQIAQCNQGVTRTTPSAPG